ncbi:MAG: ABC transporter ATP-binding protein [Alphaproteobacteria bacterium]
MTQSTETAVRPESAEQSGWILAGRFWRRWLAGHRMRLVLGLALMLVTAAATAAYPKLIEWTLTYLKERDPVVIWLMPLLAVVVSAVWGLSYFAQTVVTNGVIMRVIAQVQEALFAHLVRADLGRLMGESTGKLITRFTNDVNALRNALSKLITNGLRDIFMAAGLVGMMIYYDWLLAIIVLIVYPVAFYPITVIGRRLRRLAKNTQVHMGDMTSVLYESFTGARMVKAYGLEGYEQRRASSAFERMFRLWMKNTHYKARLEPMLQMLGGVAVGGVIAFGSWRVISGAATEQTLLAFISALIFLSQPIRALGSLNAVTQEGLAAVQRIFDILDEVPEIQDAPGAKRLQVTKGEISFERVSFAYGTDAPALRDVSLNVPGGRTVALVGRSGAGKSTIFNLIPRFFEAGSGAITIDGQNIRSVTLASLRGAMALVSQDVIIFNDTVGANIAFGRLDATREEIVAAARAAAAHDFIMRLPRGYDTEVGDRGFKLSGGERQRLALARAVLKDAPILLLDEATSALDSESERLVQKSLEELSRGRTTLVIAHRLATVRRADLIAVLDRGRIVETGTHHELLARDGLYTQLSKLQLLEDAAPPEPAGAGP